MAAAIPGGTWRGSGGGRWRRAGAALLAALAVVAAAYLWFLAAWGFNYQRTPIAARVHSIDWPV